MRTITSHIVNPANDRVQISVLDAPGPGGANHLYGLAIDPAPHFGKLAYEAYYNRAGGKSLVSGNPLPTWDQQAEPIQDAWHAAAVAMLDVCIRNPVLSFHNGPIAVDGNGVNGITHEALLAVLIDRMEDFQAGPYSCPENNDALIHLHGALARLKCRTESRMARGVEGTHQK